MKATAVNERRKSPRRKVLKSGKILFGNGTVFDYAVRDLSQSGARIEVSVPWTIPNAFTLAIASDSFERACRVTRVSKKYLGVAFQ